jgi:hypothetical protein
MAIFKPPIGAKWWADLGSEGMPLTVAVNELIANSIDSWIENPPTRGSRKKLTIHVEISTNYVLVADDASGMNGLTLQEAMGPSKADKSSSDFADDLMGMYGLGLKSATANIGGHFEILTKEQNQNVNHLVMPIQLMKEQDEFLGDIEEGSYNGKTELKNSLTKKFEEKYLQKSGTVVVITKLKNPTIRADKKTHQSLSLAWKYFLKKNKFGKEVDIFLNGEKIEKPQLGYPLIIVPNTKVNFQIPVSLERKSWYHISTS